jgi:7-cyano-7-deazaguanine synthase
MDEQASRATSPALVLLSGGQDSATCLYWARERFGSVLAVSFDYGQRHRVELLAAAEIGRMAGVERHTVLPVEALAVLGGSGLVDPSLAVDEVGQDGLPASFVPGRNVLFMVLAAAAAYRWGVEHLVAGFCQTDYSGYPDCRNETVVATQQALSLGMDRRFTVHTPLMWLTKAESVHMARNLQGCWDALGKSVTCYRGQPACGRCPACRLRAKGFEESGLADPACAMVASPCPS